MRHRLEEGLDVVVAEAETQTLTVCDTVPHPLPEVLGEALGEREVERVLVPHLVTLGEGEELAAPLGLRVPVEHTVSDLEMVGLVVVVAEAETQTLTVCDTVPQPLPEVLGEVLGEREVERVLVPHLVTLGEGEELAAPLELRVPVGYTVSDLEMVGLVVVVAEAETQTLTV